MSKAQEVLASISTPKTDEAVDLSKVSDSDLKKAESVADSLYGAGVLGSKIEAALFKAERSLKAVGLDSELKKVYDDFNKVQPAIMALATKADELVSAEIKKRKK